MKRANLAPELMVAQPKWLFAKYLSIKKVNRHRFPLAYLLFGIAISNFSKKFVSPELQRTDFLDLKGKQGVQER